VFYPAGCRGRSGPRFSSLPLSLAPIALTSCAAGLKLLWDHGRGDAVPYRAAAGFALMALGLVQGEIVHRLLHAERGRRDHRLPWRPLAAWLVVGIVVCYGLGLVLGPEPSVCYLVAAALSAWYTVGLLPLVQPKLAQRIAGWIARPRIHRLEWAVVALAGVLCAVEGGLRVFDWLTDRHLTISTALAELKFIPGSEYRGGQVNRLGYWDNEFQTPPRRGRFCVAALGHEIALCGTSQTNCLAEIERRAPGIEVYNFGLPHSTPRHYVAQLTSEVTRFQPELVLVFLSIGHDIVSQEPMRSEYDWRSLRLVQCGSRLLQVPTACAASDRHAPADLGYEEYVRASGHHLAVCRTPIDADMQRHWRATTGHLDQLATHCRERGIAIGLVLVPCEFQVSSALCQTASRRMGYDAAQLDLELPQRRLARFAQERNLPVIDLLPHFRACGFSPYRRHASELNEQGNELATQVIGAWLETRYGPQIAATAQAAVE
jgi:hypothetical protein